MSTAPVADLDVEWNVNLVVIQAKIGCERGLMFDEIGVPREGCATFCDDGYPKSESTNFGAAEGRKQREVPRAYLRSATHEITHTFNQMHQEDETLPDNSIMSTTPSVADELGGPSSGLAGVFPDDIDLNVNTNVRHHLNHMPDPVVRPGGWPFLSWFGQVSPQASDRLAFAPTELELSVTAEATRVALGEPVNLSWTVTNRSAVALDVPNDVSTQALFATIAVSDSAGRQRLMRPFVIRCDGATLAPLLPGKSISAATRVFWSTAGFAFETPGRYRINVSLHWSARGVPVGVDGAVDVFVEYPTSDADNRAAELVLHPEVGKWVALGGNASHLPEARRRLAELADAKAGAPKLQAAFKSL